MGNKLKDYALAIVALMCSSSVYSDVVINEIMPCNISTYLNEEKDFTGWVELYNDGSKDVDIKGWTFTNYNLKASTSTEKVKWTWTVESSITVKAGGYKVIPFDAYQPSGNNKYHETHAPYKLDPDGGAIEISDNKSFDYTLKYPKMKTHLSYGTDEDGVNGYMEPTPKKANSTAYKSLESQCATPSFGDVKPAIYPHSEKEGSKKIKITCGTEGATIRYTLDGSMPTIESDVFKADSAIKMNETRVIRARAFKSGKLPSDVLTGSFIIYSGKRDDCSGEDPAVVSIITDNDYFYSEDIGICVTGNSGVSGEKSCISTAANYNRDWSRGVNFEYFEQGDQKICQEAIVGVMGGCSRKSEYKVKSFKVSTNKRTGNETFDYKIYKNESTKKNNIYSSFQLRNGGNGYEDLVCRDGFMQSIAKEIGDIDYQAYIPVSYYINGNYKGMMGLRERTNESYVKANYGLDEDKIDIVEFSQKKIEAACGDLNAYNEMYAFVTDSVNYKKDNFVALLDNYMDVEEYVNYMIFEQFIVNTDWPGNNQKAWRKHVGGKFRWILYDTDFGLGLYDGWGPNYTNKSLNTITWCTGEGSESNWATEEYEWKTKFFRCLMKNQGFREMFVTKALVLLDGPLSPSAIEKVKEEFLPTVEKELCMNKTIDERNYHIDAASKLKSMVNFAKERNSIYKNDLAKYCKLDTTKKTVLVINSKGDFKSKVQGFYVNNVTIEGNSLKIKSLRGMNTNIRAILPDGYSIKAWRVTTDTTISYKTQMIDIPMKGDTIKVDLTITEETYDKPSIVINEVCSKSRYFIEPDSQEPSDWIELYNTGDDYVDIAGYYLSDNDTTIQIAKGYEMTNIPPKGHLLLWADGRGKSGVQHLAFKLDAYGENLVLSKKVRDSVILVDRVKTSKLLEEDYSYGREKDGSAKFTTFAACAGSEFSEATPGEENGKYDCETIIDELTYTVSLASSFEGAQYNINDKVMGPNKLTTYVLKSKPLTIAPVLPRKAEFIRWELSTPIESYDSIISFNSQWSYHSADSQPAGNWIEKSYNDAKWSTGNGKMGYYDGSSKVAIYDTKIPYMKGDSAKYMTTYFRHKFNVEDTSVIKSFNLSVMYDDAVAIYLNGKEIKRLNLPEDTTLSYDIAANTYYDDLKEEFKVDVKKLNIGENIIAAEVHQNDRASSDMTFQLYAKCKVFSKICKQQSFSINLKDKFSAVLVVDDRTELEARLKESNPISFYPNPTENFVYLNDFKESATVSVYDPMGKLLLIQFISSEYDAIDLSKLPAGQYIIRAASESNVAMGKIIKK